ncbi:MAG: ABC transporter permease [Candidatus Latescibacterota bacterium]|nr:ABC transporter permease [Candidatus Latescibacterota bacterium]
MIGRELRSHVLTYRFFLGFVLLFVLIVSSAVVLGLNYDSRLDAYFESQIARGEQLKEATDFRRFQWRGAQHEKPPNALSVFTVGFERELSRTVTISQWSEPTFGRSKYANPLYTLFPAPDLLYIVNIVGSLLAVLFAFNTVSGEQEDGTLRLVMANSVPRHLVLLAKWAGGYIALIVPFLVSVLVGLALASVFTSFRLSGAEWTAFLAILGVSALYLSCFYTLALAISVATHRSATSLVLSFLAWVVLVLAIPNIAPIVARSLVPVPSPGAIAGQQEALVRGIWAEIRPKMRQAERSQRGTLRDEARHRIADETKRLMKNYLQKVDSQIDAGVALARLSPSASYVYATASLAGSGLEDFAGLRTYIDRYRVDYMQALRDIGEERNRQLEGVSDSDERDEIRNAPIDPDDLPVFVPDRRPMTEILVSADMDLLLLTVLNAVFFLASYVGFLRYDLMR